MNEELKRKIHEVVEECAAIADRQETFWREGSSGNQASISIGRNIRALKDKYALFIDGLPTSADLDADAQERRIAEETK
jgi:hypothetical protein